MARRNARVKLDCEENPHTKAISAIDVPPRRDHCPCPLQPPLADVTMRRHAYCGRKRAREVKDAERRDVGEIGNRDIVSKMLLDIIKNTPQASLIEPVTSFNRQADGTSIPMRV